MIKVSVIIPTFNRPNLLARSIKSVLAQTYKDFELLIMHNGACSAIRDVVANFQKSDDRVKYFYHRKQGANHARNMGIQLSRGEYISFLDDDDEWKPEKLARQVEALDQNPSLGWVACQADVFGPQGQSFGRAPYREHPDTFLELASYGCTVYSLSLTMIRKKRLEEVGFFDVRYSIASDYDLYLRLARRFNFITLKKCLVNYYHHGGNKSKDLTWLEDRIILRRLAPEPSLGVTREVIEDHLRRLPILLYNKASVSLNRKEYLHAVKFFVSAIRHDPLIGLKMQWSRHKNKFYRLMKPYLAVGYCLAKSMVKE